MATALPQTPGYINFTPHGEKHQSSTLNAPFIVVNKGNLRVKILVRNILFIQAEHIYVRIYCGNNQNVLQRISLTSLLQELPRDSFLRVHRSFVVNLAYVDQWSKSAIYLKDHEIPIGRGRREAVLEKLGALSNG
ncbi:LytTR family DNA-binding domain-containing protein [Lewinella sp. W8]|uniref:LytR/AlgR family response regulator transcription factor n=1 Tax=Lewinella sp. W8 TaxID=2528208 RepID=UPI0015631B44|nr:LytTR family DNA-binding domain-containing protein [Lewinella sp. W8]